MIVETTAKTPANMVQFLNTHWGGMKTCTVCGSNKWSIEENLAELRFLNVGAFTVGGPVIPLVVVICATCGHTVLFNPLRAGWTPPAPATAQGGL